jgi:antitoxin (DNA-binding transcriptional repressor) of toxin-antitoxin stability system
MPVAAKSASVKKPSGELPEELPRLEVGRIGSRELRNHFRQMCEAGSPLIVTRGRSKVAAFIPIKKHWYGSPESLQAARKALLEAAKRIADMLSDC